MDKVMVTLLLIIAGVVCSVVIINAAFPAITGSTGAITDTASKISDRIRSQVKIIEVANTGSNLYVWIKNVGTSRILGIESSDIFFGPEGNFSRVPHGAAGSSEPYWDYSIENASNWGPTATVKITVHSGTALSGSYYFKMVIPNGITEETIYSTT
jgi:archaeal flagellar protein FlaG